MYIHGVCVCFDIPHFIKHYFDIKQGELSTAYLFTIYKLHQKLRVRKANLNIKIKLDVNVLNLGDEI